MRQGNYAAEDWAIVSPAGTVYKFSNLRRFIREHQELFTAEQLEAGVNKKDKRMTRVETRLRCLSPRRKRPSICCDGWLFFDKELGRARTEEDHYKLFPKKIPVHPCKKGICTAKFSKLRFCDDCGCILQPRFANRNNRGVEKTWSRRCASCVAKDHVDRVCKHCGVPLEKQYVKRGKHKGRQYYRVLCATCLEKKRAHHVCKTCGVTLVPKTLKRGKGAGKGTYYTTLCDECFAAYAASYDKYTEQTCVICGEVYKVGNKRYFRTVDTKTCSRACSTKLRRQHCQERESWRPMMTEEAIDKASAAAAGKEQKSPLNGKFETNASAKEYHFTSPDGVDYSGRNVSLFVREHPELFSAEDYKERRRKLPGTRRAVQHVSRAKGGLHKVHSGDATVWKGWKKTTPHYEDTQVKED